MRRRIRSGVKCGSSTISAPAPCNQSRSSWLSCAAFAWRNRISVFSAASRALASTSTSPGEGKRSAPRSRWIRPSPAFSGAGREVQISQCRSSSVRRIRSISDAHRSPASARYSVDPKASSATNTCAAIGIEHAPDLLRADALMRFPPVCELRQRDRSGDRGLPHLGRAAQHGEPMSVEDPERASVRRASARTPPPAHARPEVERGASADLGVDQLIEVAQPEDRRHRATQLGTCVQPLADLGSAQDPYLHALVGESIADPSLELGGALDVGQRSPAISPPRRPLTAPPATDPRTRVKPPGPPGPHPRAQQQHRFRRPPCEQRRRQRGPTRRPRGSGPIHRTTPTERHRSRARAAPHTTARSETTPSAPTRSPQVHSGSPAQTGRAPRWLSASRDDHAPAVRSSRATIRPSSPTAKADTTQQRSLITDSRSVASVPGQWESRSRRVTRCSCGRESECGHARSIAPCISPAAGMASGRSASGRPTRSRFDLSSHLEASSGGDRRRGPSMDGADDLGAVDAL